jgi:eukaryotic-like serine/threonine-protein kinase
MRAFSYASRVTAPVSPTALPAGFVLNGRYEVLRPLGNGANGYVYEVADHNTGQVSALKIIVTAHPSTVWDEARVLAGLDGEFILPIRNADLASGLPFLVTPVAERGNTADAIKNAATVGLPVDLAGRWTQQACRGLSRVHDRGLLHNDVKPDNIFVGEKGEALLGDLGLACLRDSTGMGHFAGTPATMAPEVAVAGISMMAGGPPLRPTTIASDVYSLGATLYWFLSGIPPHFDNRGPLETMQLVAAGPPPDLRDAAPHVPLGLGEIVAKAMHRDPVQRYRNPADLDAALGGRSRQRRQWARQRPHPAHEACFLGDGHGQAIELCAVPTGLRHQHQILSHYAGSHRAIKPWPLVPTPRSLPRALRSRMRELS